MTTLLQRVKNRISRTTSRSVFIRSDFDDLGGYDQIGRALRALTKDGIVMKMGYGVYIKTRRNRFTNELMPDIEGGVDAALLETLKKLKVEYELTGLTKGYLEGQMTQIPARTQIKTKKRFTRKLAIGDFKLNAC